MSLAHLIPCPDVHHHTSLSVSVIMSPELLQNDDEVLSEWDPDDPEPRPPVLKHELFILRLDDFTVYGHSREDAERIKNYVDGESLRMLEAADKEEIELALKGMNRRARFHSQLIHYGVYSREGMPIIEDYTLKTILPLMRKAVSQQWVRQTAVLLSLVSMTPSMFACTNSYL